MRGGRPPKFLPGGQSLTTATTDLDTLAVNTIRGLCMDAVRKANSGHPGTPMGIAPVAYTPRHRRRRGRPTHQPAEQPPGATARVAVEQASTLGWDRYVGGGGAVIGMHTFGASAPLKQLLTKFGFTPEQVAQAARERVAAARDGRA